MAPTDCRRTVSGSFSLPCSGFFFFTPLFGVLFTFPSQYWFTIGLLVVFSLTGWSRPIQTGFLVSRPTQDTAIFTSITCTQLSCSPAGFSKTVPVPLVSNIAVLQPQHCRNNAGLGSFPFARRYSGNRCFFLFLLLLRCFSSEGWPIFRCDWPPASRVVPFGYLRIKSRLQIPAAFRSLPRPSSPPRA